jgi:hypothetical protein
MTGPPGRERRPGPPASGTGAITQTQVQGDTETVSTLFETFNLFGPAPGPRSRCQAALEETIAKLRHPDQRHAGREPKRPNISGTSPQRSTASSARSA